MRNETDQNDSPTDTILANITARNTHFKKYTNDFKRLNTKFKNLTIINLIIQEFERRNQGTKYENKTNSDNSSSRRPDSNQINERGLKF